MRFGRLLFAAALAALSLLAVKAEPTFAQSYGYAEHAPGTDLTAEGNRFYQNGWFFTARHRFKRAAHWADKMAQHNLGVIWYRGDGVERDPARAWAWFELAAERDYPEFVGIANAVWDELSPVDRQRGRAYLDDLMPRYEDAVAVPRTARRMTWDRRQVTGSRVGFVGNLEIYDIDSAVPRSGEEYFSEETWDFEQIVSREKQLFDALARARVTIGEMEFVEDEADQDDPGARDGR